MVKLIKQLLKKAVGTEEEFSFEERLIISYVLYTAIVCFISTFANLWLNLGIGLVLLMIVSTFLFSVAYFFGRFWKKIGTTKIIFGIYSLVLCNIFWYLNFGSHGSALYIFPVCFFIMIFAYEIIYIKIIGLVFVVNILVLMSLELSIPGFVPNYPSERARITDVYVSLLLIMGFLAIIIISAKNNYIKQYKKAQQSDKLKSAFLANMSHEIRTPLNAIIGFSQLIVERELPKDKKDKYSNLITQNGDYLMKLISDILDISMIESGQLKITNSRVNLNKLCKGAFLIHDELIKEKYNSKVELMLDLPLKAIVIEIDEMRLKQIVFNLISNAIKYTAEGYIKFGYTSTEKEIIFFVEDTGCGIKEEFQPEIFNRFVRYEEGREVKTTRGAGIGLSLSKDLVHILGGQIWFSSIYKEGTTFYFSLPAPSESEGSKAISVSEPSSIQF